MEGERSVGDWRGTAWVYWLLPASFLVHDGEELLTMPGWVERHGHELAELAGRLGLDPAVVGSLPSTRAEAAGAIGAVALLFLAVTFAAVRARGEGVPRLLYATLLGGYLLHVLTHVAQSVAFGGYTPGVLGAVFVSLPASLYVYRRLLRARLLDRRTAVVSALVGLALFVPAVLLAQSLGRWLGGR